MFLHKMYICVLLLLLSSLRNVSTSFMDYIWPKPSQKINQQYSELDIRTIPFELSERDEKFLQHANELIGLKHSELDKCHNRVIFTLTKSCHTLNSEDLGKLAVMLLNCQSAAEGRQLFPCTENMSLKECTQDMNSDTWNTYHLVTNRAKAVCYRIRQEQFQGLTEITVNKLMNTAHSQLNLMVDITANQKRLDQETKEALKSVQGHSIELLEQQRLLATSHAATRATVDSNIRALLNEKALIKSGQAEVMAVVKRLLEKLELASTQLDTQKKEREISHQEILNDIRIIHENAEDVWLKIEQSTSYLTDQNSIIFEQYEKTLQQLRDINSTINYLGKVLDRTKSEIDDKLNWLNDTLEGTGYTLDLFYFGFSYFLFMIMLMIISAFLNLSKSSRFIAVIIVLTNLVLEERHIKTTNISALDLKGLSIAIICILIGRSIVTAAAKKIGCKAIYNNNENESIADSKDYVSNQETSTSHTSKVYMSPIVEKNNWNASLPTVNEHKKEGLDRESSVETEIMPLFDKSEYLEAMGTPSEFTPPVSRTGYNSTMRFRSNTPSSLNTSKKLCDAKTRKGDFCKNYALFGRDYCSRHQLGSSIMGDI